MSLTVVPEPEGPGVDLSIGDLADLVELSVATLRVWETRHGFPAPRRRMSGHRRYDARDLAMVREVVRRRGDGVRLDVAIAQVVDAGGPPQQSAGGPAGAQPSQAAASHASETAEAPSVFARVRRFHPRLAPQRLSKATLLSLTWAIEDEFASHPQRARVFGAFQRVPFFDSAEARWKDLALASASTYVFADFSGADIGRYPDEPGELRVVPLGVDHPMRREWAVVIDGPELSIALTAWERPGQRGTRDRDRVFEALWTVEPAAVRSAARVCAEVAYQAGARGGAEVRADLAGAHRDDAADPDLVSSLFNRSISYVDGPSPH